MTMIMLNALPVLQPAHAQTTNPIIHQVPRVPIVIDGVLSDPQASDCTPRAASTCVLCDPNR